MVDTEKRDELAAKLLERHLVTNREEALALATKFLEMEVSEGPTPDVAQDPAPLIIGDALESAPAAEQAYASVLYYEQLKLEPTGRNPFPNARTKETAPAAPVAPQPTPKREQPTIDISQMFNVDNMRKNAQES